ncbi:LOW QUALITY PROTEIN: uncharacterized protein LOC126783958 [Argentina anserina]|uniref:LOW QUALITY PROTEIN: uncharacterized protein LOC126783958 n=1 Tax=Argentina anserina TaxID=57926 RepID=UPI002176273F|nr:LOW QUALITY PROTEIN: uncharacterized protein LOC126783958 [Potentilla anserina]
MRDLPLEKAKAQSETCSTLRCEVHISLTGLTLFLLRAWRQLTFGTYGYLNFTKPGFIEHSKNFKAEDMETRIDGKNCIVTGANSGIGFATAEGLASRGATIYMVCRNKERGEAAQSKIESTTGNQNVHLEVCNLSSLSDVKSFVGLQIANLKSYIFLSQVALTEKWAEMNKSKGIGFYSMHPGWAETAGVAKSLPSFFKALSGKLRTNDEGADTIIWLALQPKEKLVSGAFYFDRAEAPKHLMFAATSCSHEFIDSVIDSLRCISGISAQD